VGDTTNQTLYNCFPYGAYIGTKLINEGNGGPQNLLSMGLGIDGSRKSVYFGSGLTGTMNFIDNQIVSLNNDQPITRYFETEGNSDFTANFYNTDLWGFPEKAVVMKDNSGSLNLYTANFQQRGYNGALNIGNGNSVKVVSSGFNTNNAQFSSGSSNISLMNTVADYSANEGNTFAQNIANFATAVSVDENSQAMSQINRRNWVASSNVNNYMAAQSLDGDLTTQWNSSWQAPGQWYQVDMGSNQQFDTIVTTLGPTNDSPGAYKVLVSNDGSNWRQVASGEHQNIYSVGPQNARYIRIEQSSSAGKFWAIYEFYVLNSVTYDVGTGEVIEPETEPEPETEVTTEQKTEAPTEVTTEQETTKPSTEGHKYTAAEAEVEIAGIFDSTNAYGGKNIGNMHLADASFTFHQVDGCNGGNATVSVHYATNDASAQLRMVTNNTTETLVNFRSTGGWENYTGVSTVNVSLNPGKTNTISFRNVSGGVNVDYIEVSVANSDAVKILGYQISYTLKGIRVLSSIEKEIDGKKVVKSGNIYGLLSKGATEADLVLNSNHRYVASYEYNGDGLLKSKPGTSDTATYYAMTMTKNGTNAKAFSAEYGVRAYAILEDGTVVYSKVKKYTIYKIAQVLYNNRQMSNRAGHEYLYEEILKIVNPNYEEVDYNWSDEIVKAN
jgi:hypothetical protein